MPRTSVCDPVDTRAPGSTVPSSARFGHGISAVHETEPNPEVSALIRSLPPYLDWVAGSFARHLVTRHLVGRHL